MPAWHRGDYRALPLLGLASLLLKWLQCRPPCQAGPGLGGFCLLHPESGLVLGRGWASREPRTRPPARHRLRQAAGTHRVDAEGVRSQEDAGDVGVQGEQRLLGQEGVAVTRAGGLVRGPGASGLRGGRGWASPPARLVGHGRHAPARGEDGRGAAEALVVDEAGVDGEQAHEQEQVAAPEEGPPDLGVQAR